MMRSLAVLAATGALAEEMTTDTITDAKTRKETYPGAITATSATGTGKLSVGSFETGDFKLEVDTHIDMMPQVTGTLTVTKHLALMPSGDIPEGATIATAAGVVSVCEPSHASGDSAGTSIKADFPNYTRADCKTACAANDDVKAAMTSCTGVPSEEQSNGDKNANENANKSFAPWGAPSGTDCQAPLKACVRACAGSAQAAGVRSQMRDITGDGSLGVCRGAKVELNKLGVAKISIEIGKGDSETPVVAKTCAATTEIQVDVTATDENDKMVSGIQCKEAVALKSTVIKVKAKSSTQLAGRKVVSFDDDNRRRLQETTVSAADMISWTVLDEDMADKTADYKVCCFTDGLGFDLKAAEAEKCPACDKITLTADEAGVYTDDGWKKVEKTKVNADGTVSGAHDGFAAAALAAMGALFARW